MATSSTPDQNDPNFDNRSDWQVPPVAAGLELTPNINKHGLPGEEEA